MRGTMTATQKLLDKAQKQTGTRYALAKALQMDQSNLTRAIKGTLNLGPKHAVLLAALLDLEAMDVIALTQADAARDAATKEFWHRKVPRFLLALTLAVMVGGLSANRGLARDGCEPIYIMRTRKKAA